MAAQAASETCTSCPYREGCFAETVRAEAPLLAEIRRKLRGRLEDEDVSETVLTRVSRYLLKRKRTATDKPARELPREEGLTRKLADSRIDVAAIKCGENPFPETMPIYRHATAFILETGPFKAKDVVEDIAPRVDFTTSSLKTEVSRLLRLLTEAGVLERNGTILCLSK